MVSVTESAAVVGARSWAKLLGGSWWGARYWLYCASSAELPLVVGTDWARTDPSAARISPRGYRAVAVELRGLSDDWSSALARKNCTFIACTAMAAKRTKIPTARTRSRRDTTQP